MAHSYSHRLGAFWIVVVAVLTGRAVKVQSFSLTATSARGMRSFTRSMLVRPCPTQCSIRAPRRARSAILLRSSSTQAEAEPGTSNSTDPPTSQPNYETPTTAATAPQDRHADFPEWAYQERPFFRYELIHQSARSQARVGRIHTPHGIIDTPGFVAVATNAALKAVDFGNADQAGQQLIFANTYHLLIHPGSEIVRDAGGIHQWTSRTDRPFITDSGGFQVFSLAYGSVHEELSSKGELKRANGKRRAAGGDHSDMVSVTEQGVDFRSYRDGSRFLLTPESTVQAQKDIGADIIIPLDELPPYHVDRNRLVDSVDRTHRWETRSLKEHLKNIQNQAMFSVIHGGIDRELRTQSIDYLTSLPFDGYAIGGSLGNGRQELKELLTWMMPLFDLTPHRQSKPRHLLGIADEESIRNAVVHGIDTMDSCYPTRVARHGTLLVRNNPNGDGGGGGRPSGSIKIMNREHARAFGVKIDDQCQCSTCQRYDRAYLWHLFKANEPVAATLAAQHNIHYMNDLMKQLRQDIMEDKI